MTGMSQSHCCGCGPKCGSYTADIEICCIEMTHTLWPHYGIMLSSGHTDFYSGDSCTHDDEHPKYSNLCGEVEGIWTIPPPGNDITLPARPGWDNTPHYCVGRYTLRWSAINEGANVRMKSSFAWPVAPGRIDVSEDIDPDWYVDGYTVEDPHVPGEFFTFKPCPETYSEFPDPDTRVILSGQFQRKQGATWTDSGRVLGAEGNCVCGGRCSGRKRRTGAFSYYYRLQYDDIVIPATEVGFPGNYVSIPYNNCNWSQSSGTYVTALNPDRRLTITPVESCPDSTIPPPPPPPPCDPGCWPECVMCPERKNLYLVIDNDPACCLAGTYALTWSGTGTTGSYSLASPIGGPSSACGIISAFTVTCVDATHIHVSITYRVIYAPEVSTLTESYNMSVSCVGGHMESEAVSYTLSGDQDGLCGSGSDYGGNIRVVSD